MHDVEFFDHLRQQRKLSDFQIVSCGFVAGSPPGRDGIDYLTRALDALPGIPFFSQLEAILVVADNDSDPPAAFAKIQRLINDTKDISTHHRYIAPTAGLTRAGANPKIVVMMLPWIAKPGALDTLCLTAASNAAPAIAACVEEFSKCAKTDAWPITKMGKMKLRSLIAAAHIDDPYLSPAWVWREGTGLIPLSDHVFDQIEAFLRVFPTL